MITVISAESIVTHMAPVRRRWRSLISRSMFKRKLALHDSRAAQKDPTAWTTYKNGAYIKITSDKLIQRTPSRLRSSTTPGTTLNTPPPRNCDRQCAPSLAAQERTAKA